MGDLEKQSGTEGVHAGVGQITDRLWRLLAESGNETGLVDIDHTVARRVFGREHCQGRHASPLRWKSIRRRRSKSVRLSALRARKNSSSSTQARC